MLILRQNRLRTGESKSGKRTKRKYQNPQLPNRPESSFTTAELRAVTESCRAIAYSGVGGLGYFLLEFPKA